MEFRDIVSLHLKVTVLSQDTILNNYRKSPQYQELENAIGIPKAKLHIKGLTGSALSFVMASVFKEVAQSLLLILNDKEEAAYYLNDLEQLIGKASVLFYPGSYKRPYQYQVEETDNANVLLRSEVLHRINTENTPLLVVTYPDALFEKVVDRNGLKKNTLKIGVGDQISPDFINEVLFEYRFKRVEFVTEPGEFSLRGGIVDVFSFSNEDPYRIEFFGDEVESIRIFDIATQLSIKKVDNSTIVPHMAHQSLKTSREGFLNYIAKKTILFCKDPEILYGRIDMLFAKAKAAFETDSQTIKHTAPEALFCDAAALKGQLAGFTLVRWGTSSIQDLSKNTEIKETQQKREQKEPLPSSERTISFHTTPQPSFNKQFHLLIEQLNTNYDLGYKNYIFCANAQQAKRFHNIFEDAAPHVADYKTIVQPLYQGFIDSDLKIACYTDHQLFERYHKFHLKNSYSKKQAITLKELTTLKKGDYVTHIDHGIGKFGGLQKIEVEGKFQEAIKLIYGDRDILYVSIYALHKISKYNGKDGKPPKIYKLGSAAWKALKQKTKKKVKEIAFNLIELYAKRKMQKGFCYAPDSYMQHELEASFLYEDTPDQSKATKAVKADMESPHPMDRLVCGDVGFGKTEIAIRAAFKAVDNNKQVAILTPTTILTFQHFKTFSERLEDFPVTIAYINRFRTTKEKKEILEKLEKGTIDIIIGTHLLSGKHMAFKDLGLLIVDEEQKFGVAVKEKLKTIKENLDVLTLTATPIPRTLQFSLMAARDLSVINTPPPNRHPTDSHVIPFNEDIIRDAIQYEIQRGGQVFFVHNRIENIREVSGMLQRLLPDAKIGIAHGQIEGKKLEKLILEFMDGNFDILVSTTIIENGLDVPNANTIFINNANNFGLSDLHQIRGRVGRSNKKAFCYFITPPYSAMSDEARKRIQALEQYTELGSGFNIAMKDLEIRGSGDLLGGEQSGFINEMGFDTYQKIVQEAIEELKDNEFKTLYTPQDTDNEVTYVKETQLDTDFELLFPDTYINNISERLHLYTELSQIKTEAALHFFKTHLEDRFGPLPAAATGLLHSVKIKWLATQIGLEKVVLKKGKIIGYFITDQQSEYYQSDVFKTVLQHIQENPNTCKIKEKQTRKGLRLLLIFDHITSIEKAWKSLATLIPEKQRRTILKNSVNLI